MRIIMSVSTFSRSSGAAMARSTVNFATASAPEFPHVADRARERRRGRHGRACEMRARARSLPADEIAVRGRDRALAARHRLAIGGEAHRAAGIAPREAGRGEDAVEAFGLGLALDILRAGHDPGAHMRADRAAPGHLGGGPQIRGTPTG